MWWETLAGPLREAQGQPPLLLTWLEPRPRGATWLARGVRSVWPCAGKRGERLRGWLLPLPGCVPGRGTREMAPCVAEVSDQGFKAICLCYDESGFSFQISISK